MPVTQMMKPYFPEQVPSTWKEKKTFFFKEEKRVESFVRFLPSTMHQNAFSFLLLIPSLLCSPNLSPLI